MTSLIQQQSSSQPFPVAAAVPSQGLVQLSDRHGYTTCHVQLPDHPRPIAAIAFEHQYYSLFMARQSEPEARAIAQRLQQQGDQVLVTGLPTGFAIWVWEPQAQVTSFQRLPAPSPFSVSEPEVETIRAAVPSPSHSDRPQPSMARRSPVPERYQACHIRVPYQEGRLAAICVDQRYYSLFRIVNQAQQANRVEAKLRDRGCDVMVTETVRGYALWVLEVEAWPA